MADKLKVEYVEVSELELCPDNPRKNDENVPALVKSMEAFGWTNPILVRRENNMVIAGHTRLKAALEKGVKEVPVVYLDLNEADSKTYMIADNKLTENVDWDMELLAGLFDELGELDIDLDLTGFDKLEIGEMTAGWPEPLPELGIQGVAPNQTDYLVVLLGDAETAAKEWRKKHNVHQRTITIQEIERLVKG